MDLELLFYLNLLQFGIIGLVIMFLYKKLSKIEPDGIEDSIQKGIRKMNSAVNKKLSTISVDLFKDEATQQQIAGIVMGSVMSIVEDNEAMTAISSKVMAIVTQSTGIPLPSPEQDAEAKKIAQDAFPQLMSAVGEEMIPAPLMLALNAVKPNWREDLAKNPKVFAYLLDMFQNSGLVGKFGLDKLLGSSSTMPPVEKLSQTREIKF